MFPSIRTAAQYDTYVSDTTTHQDTQSHTDYMTAKNTSKQQACCQHTVNIINNFFNQNNPDETDLNKTSITVYVGNMTTSNKNDMISELEGKGYTCVEDNNRLTIST